ncbi:hypothetical protein JQK88_20265 [Mesorhizobium caraganae]|nr:hypothetical protein [Mesorhizobium caraganae]
MPDGGKCLGFVGNRQRYFTGKQLLLAEKTGVFERIRVWQITQSVEPKMGEECRRVRDALRGQPYELVAAVVNDRSRSHSPSDDARQGVPIDGIRRREDDRFLWRADPTVETLRQQGFIAAGPHSPTSDAPYTFDLRRHKMAQFRGTNL